MKIVQVTLIFYMQKFDLKILDDFIDCKTLFEILKTSGQILFRKSKKPLSKMAGGHKSWI